MTKKCTKYEFNKAVYIKTNNDRHKIDTRLSTCSWVKSWNWFLKPDNSQLNQKFKSEKFEWFWRREAWKSEIGKGNKKGENKWSQTVRLARKIILKKVKFQPI